MAPRVTDSPQRCAKNVAIFPNDPPHCLLRVAAHARATGPGPARGLQFVLQSLILAAQPIALTLHASQLLAQARIVPLRAGQFVAQDAVRRRGLFGAIGHTPVMPELKNLYKYGILDRLSGTR